MIFLIYKIHKYVLLIDHYYLQGGYSDEVNYAALDFTVRKSKQVKKKKELPQECVYSAVSADYHTHDHNSM